MKQPKKTKLVPKSLFVRGSQENTRRALFGRVVRCDAAEYEATPTMVVVNPEPEVVVTVPPPPLSEMTDAQRTELTEKAIHRLDLFDCIPLKCRLTRASCADRHVKGKACVVDGPTQRGAAISPVEWAPYVPTCRTCPVGAATAKALKTPKPTRKYKK